MIQWVNEYWQRAARLTHTFLQGENEGEKTPLTEIWEREEERGQWQRTLMKSNPIVQYSSLAGCPSRPGVLSHHLPPDYIIDSEYELVFIIDFVIDFVITPLCRSLHTAFLPLFAFFYFNARWNCAPARPLFLSLFFSLSFSHLKTSWTWNSSAKKKV